MSTAIIVLIVAVAVIVVVAIVSFALMQSQKKGTEQLQEKFGPEYDRALGESASKKDAEAQLRERQERVEQLHLRELETDERVRLSRAWATTQARFVDEPPAAIAEAQSLVDEAMSARGYPMGDFAQRAADISVDHPNVVTNYRAARAIADTSERGQADTESLRQAMVHYRALFDDLLGGRIEDTKLDDLSTPSRTGGRQRRCDARGESGQIDASTSQRLGRLRVGAATSSSCRALNLWPRDPLSSKLRRRKPQSLRTQCPHRAGETGRDRRF